METNNRLYMSGVISDGWHAASSSYYLKCLREHPYTSCDTTETWGSFAAPRWQSCTEGRCHRNEWAPLACPWHPSLPSHGTSWKAAWSRGSEATARWCGGGTQSSCFWDGQKKSSGRLMNRWLSTSEMLVWGCKGAWLKPIVKKNCKMF